MIDGASHWLTIRRVTLSLCLLGFLSADIIATLMWNKLLDAL
jgi:ABC-type glycerol-3-phosphate transport system permease component